MSDYMFILESHLNADQAAALAAVQAAAGDANVSVFLTGGAMRDMLGGFPIRDLDFTVEGPALKIAQNVVKKSGAKVISIDEVRKATELEFFGGVRVEIGIARQERYTRPGAPPKVTPATIHEDLRGRDFTINAIALSLNRASRGLLIDPTNGQSDLDRKELRQVSSYGFYDDPVRMMRLLRFKSRLGFAVDERTQSSYQNAREAECEKNIGPRQLYNELRQITFEQNPQEVLKSLEDEGFLKLYTPALAGPKLNAAGLAKLHKAIAMIPFGAGVVVDDYALLLHFLTQLLNPKEKAALVAATQMSKQETDPWQKLDQRSKKLESAVKSARLSKPSQIYDLLKTAKGEEMIYLFLKSNSKTAQDRIKNHLTKYLPTMLDVTDAEVVQATGLEPGNPKFAKAKTDRIAGRIDGRIRKPVPEPIPEPPPPTGRSMGRAARFR
jgi:tRNA nucleotidyltransferase (CCA-adding enzyme)